MEGRKSSDEIDAQRSRDLVYLYLCRLDEAKIWLETVVDCKLPSDPFEIEENLRSGVVLARLAQKITPELVPDSAIFDSDHTRYDCGGPMFRHTDNINLWLQCVRSSGLPRIFLPELADVYDKKNIPRLIHCLHALSVHMNRTMATPPMTNLAGQLHVSDAVINEMQEELKKLKVAMPAFHDSSQPLPQPPTLKPVEEILNICDRVVNELQTGNYTSLLSVLQECPEVRSILKSYAAPLYFAELNDYLCTFGKISLEVLVSSVNSLNVVADVSQAVDSHCPQRVFHSIVALDRFFQGALALPQDCDEHMGEVYLQHLAEAKCKHELLTLERIQDCIDLAHSLPDSTGGSAEESPVVEMSRQSAKSLKRRSSQFCDPSPFKSPRRSFPSEESSGPEETDNQNTEEGVTLTEEAEETNGNDVEDVPAIVEGLAQEVSQSREAINYALLSRNLQQCAEWSFVFPNSERHQYEETNVSKEEAFKSAEYSNENSFTQPCEIAVEHKENENRQDFKLLNVADSCESSFFVACTAPFRNRNVQQSSSAEQVVKFEIDEPKTMRVVDDESDKENAGNKSDHAIEVLVQNVRREVVEAIKKNDALALSVEELDTRIGLLVRARDSRDSSVISAAPAQPEKLTNGNVSLKAFSQHARALRQSYQKFLYLLQTRPEYLSRLLTNSGSTNRAVHRCVLNVFNMGAGHREACLLADMLARSLQLTIQSLAPSEMASGLAQSAPVRLAVYIARQAPRNPMQTLLKPFVEQVLKETIAVETNPVDIYHRWLTQTEAAEEGRPCGLPRGVDQQQALAHTHVQLTLSKNINTLKVWVAELVTSLVHNTHRLPYLVRYLGKCMRATLNESLPSSQHKQIPKIVCQVIYMAYLNCALVAPDAYHVVRTQKITRAQRTNLASIAKIVQLAASKNGFGGDSEHLAVLNGFIKTCHGTMREMVSLWCEVPEPQIHYHHTTYADATTICKPRLYITAQELCDCHALLNQHVDLVAPDSEDALRAVMSALGQPPSPASLMGLPISDNLRDSDKLQAGRVLLCLEMVGVGEEALLPSIATSVPREVLIKELDELKSTLKQLAEKKHYYEEQLNYYQKYLDTCLQHVTNNNNSKRCGGVSVKYTARELEDRGVLLKLDPVLTSQLNNVTFLFTASPSQPGQFSLECRFKRVHVDTATIDIQELLRLQFEGEEQILLFGKAHLSISHLIQLISKKLVK